MLLQNNSPPLFFFAETNHHGRHILVKQIQVGGHFIIDASLEEEACVEASVAVFVDRRRQVCGSRKEGDGAVPAQHLGGMAQCAAAMAKSIFAILDATVEKQKAGGGVEDAGAAGAGFL